MQTAHALSRDPKETDPNVIHKARVRINCSF